MRGAGDGRTDMTRTSVPDDATVEAILRRTWIPSGGEDPPELTALSVAVEAIRRSADEAVPPTAELARRIALGDFAGFAPSPLAHGRTVRARIGERVAAMSMRTRAAAVLAAIFTSFTGVAVAGALPDAAQQRVESVIETVTPISFDDSAEFGQDVAEDAQDGGVDGQEISEDAQDLGNKPADPGHEPGHEPVLPELPTTVPTTPGEHRPDQPGEPGQGDDQGAPGQGDQDEPGQGDQDQPGQDQDRPGPGRPGPERGR